IEKAPQGNHVPCGAADIDAVDIVDGRAILGLCLHLHLPGPAEQVHVIDIEAAERRLQGLEYRTDVDTQNPRLVAVDVEIDRWICRGIGGKDSRQLRILISGDHEPARDLREILWRTTLHILDHEGKPAAGTESNDWRRLQWNCGAAPQLAKLAGQPPNDCVGALSLAFSFFEALERDDDEAGIRLREIVDEIQPDDRTDVGDWRFFLEKGLDVPHNGGRAADRCSIRQLYRDKECTLVIRRKKAGWRHPREQTDTSEGRYDGCDANDRNAHQPRHDGSIVVADAIDRSHHDADDATPR